MRIPGADQAIRNLMKWSERDEWADYHDQVFADHLDHVLERCEITHEEFADLVGAAGGMIYGFMLEDFFTARYGENGELNVIDDFLSRRGWREKVPAKRYLEAIRDSVPSLYEVVDLDPGHTLTVRDMVMGGDPVVVKEKLGSESAARWDRIAGRLVTVNKKPHFTGGLLLLSHEAAESILEVLDSMSKQLAKDLLEEVNKDGEKLDITAQDAREMIMSGTVGPRVLSQAWLIDTIGKAQAPAPELRNKDGDSIMFSEVRFSITGGAAEIAAILDSIEDLDRDDIDEPRWSWLGQGSPTKRGSHGRGKVLTLKSEDMFGRTLLGSAEIAGDALVLSTNSKERAEKGRELLASRLNGLVGAPLTSHQDLEKMLAEPPASKPEEPNLSPQEAAQVLHDYLDDHYRQILNDPLPILDGKTPRQAVKNKEGRVQVIDWLKQLENSEYRRAARQGHKPYDMTWMWRELKIEESQ